MNAADETPKSSHEQVAMLIWYVTGALSDEARRDIERHLESCAECRAELAALVQLHRDLRSAYDAEPEPSRRVKDSVFDGIKAATAAEAARVPAMPPRPSSTRPGVFGLLNAWTRSLLLPQWAPAAALVLIVVQAGILVRVTTERSAPVVEVTTRGMAATATRLKAVFNPQASALQIRELLASLGARIVDGPSADGAYVIELNPGDPKAVAGKLKTARANDSVLLSLDVAAP